MKSLLQVLEDVKILLARKDNDFAWSSWNGEKAALDEISTFIEKIKAGQDFEVLTLEVWFAPTGPMQEVSLSSGWGHEFIQLADEFDAAIEEFKKK